MRARVASCLLVLSLYPKALHAHGPRRGFATFHLQPAPDGSGGLGVESARTLGREAFAAGLLLSYVDAPLMLAGHQGEASDIALIDDQLVLDATVAVAFDERWQVGAGVPIVLFQQGDFEAAGFPEGPPVAALGDMRVGIKYAVRSNADGGLGLAVAPEVTLTTGDEAHFVGEEGVLFHPRVLADFRFGRAGGGVFANLGVRLRTEDGQLESLHPYSHEATWGIAAELPVPMLRGWASVVAEYRGGTQLTNPFRVPNASPAEIDGAVRVRLGKTRFQAVAGAGAGLTNGVGAPSFRAFAGLAWRALEIERRYNPAAVHKEVSN